MRSRMNWSQTMHTAGPCENVILTLRAMGTVGMLEQRRVAN